MHKHNFIFLFLFVFITFSSFAAPTLSVEVGSCQVIDKQCFRNLQLLVKGGSGSYQKGFKIKNSSITQWFAWDDAGIVGGFLIPVGSYTFAIKDLKSNQIIEKNIDLACDEVCMPTFQISTIQSVCKSINNMCFQSVTLSTKNGSGGYLKAVRVGNNKNLTGIIWTAWSTGGDGVLNLLSNANVYTVFVRDTIQNKIAIQIVQINCPENCVDKLSLKFEKNACKNKEAKCYQDIILKVSGGTGNYEKGIRKGTSIDPTNGTISWSKWDDGSYSLLPGNYTFFVRDLDSEQFIADTSSAACPDKCLAPLSVLADLQQCFKIQDTCYISVKLRASGGTGSYQIGYKSGLNAESQYVEWFNWNRFGEDGLLEVPAGNYTFFVRDSLTKEIASSQFSEICKVCNPKLQLSIENVGCQSKNDKCVANVAVNPTGGLGNYILKIFEGKDTLGVLIANQSISNSINLSLLPNEYLFTLRDAKTNDYVSFSKYIQCPSSCGLDVQLLKTGKTYYTNFAQSEFEEIALNIKSGTPFSGSEGKYKYSVINRLMTTEEIKNFVSANRNTTNWTWWNSTFYLTLNKQKTNTLTVVAIDASTNSFDADTVGFNRNIDCSANIGSPTFFGANGKYFAHYEWANLHVKGCNCMAEISAFDEKNNILPQIIITDEQAVSLPYYASEFAGQIQNGGFSPKIKMQEKYKGKPITFEVRCTDEQKKIFSSKASYTIKVVEQLEDIGFSPCIRNDGKIELNPEGSRGEFEFYVGDKTLGGEKIWFYYGIEPYGKKAFALQTGQEVFYRTIDDTKEGERFVIPSNIPTCKSNSQSFTNNNLSIDIQAFPNPTSSELNISFEPLENNTYMLYLTDLGGRVYYKKNINGSNLKVVKEIISTDYFPVGSYQLIIIDKNQNKKSLIIYIEK